MTLGIDLEVWDCEAEYKATVVDYLVDAYAHGRTPQPGRDVQPGRSSSGPSSSAPSPRGADFVATGHYGRVERGEGGRVRLLRALDEHKDQTYFLWRVGEGALSRALLPVGEVRDKATVRRMCAERGLGGGEQAGLRRHLLRGAGGHPDVSPRRARAARRGTWWSGRPGRVLGRHDGAFLFTVGQRRGLDLGGGPARYVVSTDVEKNVVYVTADRMSPALFCREVELDDVRWVSGEPPAAGRYLVRTRHTGELREAELAGPVLRFEEPVRRVAPRPVRGALRWSPLPRRRAS